MSAGTLLGEIDLPDGILVILDPGLARFWRGDGEPGSPRPDDTEAFDLAIVGDDAEAAGRAYDREHDPRHLFDRRDPGEAKQHFEAFAAKHGFRARATLLAEQVPHTERARHALAAGGGLGIVKYNGLWAAVAGGLPTDRRLPVIGTPIFEGDFAGRWRFIDVVIDETAEMARAEEVEGIMVDHGQLLFAGLGPLGQFRAGESLDGLADYVFWGRDAEPLATAVGAEDLGDEEFGWTDLPVEEIGARARAVESAIEAEELAVGVDYRPHCHLETLNAALRQNDEDAAEIVLDGSRLVGCGNRWGDSIFSVSRLFDDGGNVVRIRVHLGTDERQKMMARLWLRTLGAIVTRSVLEDDEPIRFAERLDPRNESDSGWCFCAGTEDDEYMGDPDNLAVVSLAVVIDRFPEIDDILEAPEGATFRREGDRFVPDEGA
jgi:hypothetical protein